MNGKIVRGDTPMALTEHTKQYKIKYYKNNYRVYALKLNKETEKDLIEYLESVPNKTEVIVKALKEYKRKASK